MLLIIYYYYLFNSKYSLYLRGVALVIKDGGHVGARCLQETGVK